MERFLNYDFDIRNIVFADLVPAGTNPSTHINRPTHGIAFHTAGEKEYIFSDGTRLVVKPNDIIYLPKHSNYTVYPLIPGECYAVNFDVTEDISFLPFVTKAKNSVEYTKYFRLAKTTFEQKKQGYMLKCKAELYNILYSVQQECLAGYAPKAKLNIIRPGVEYIHTAYTRELISIQQLAGMCGITPEYFRKIFKQFYGVSPISYINNLKISRAKELMLSGLYSLTDAAMMSGYTDMSHFSREFKKATGYCPSAYIKEMT